MSDIKFACPQCQQHIQAEAGYSGMEIACPSCGGRMLVPQLATAQSSPSPPVPPLAPAGTACPACGAALAPQAILCTQCGYNLRTGQRLPTRSPAGRPAAARAPATGRAAAKGDSKWYATPYPYLGLVAVVVLTFYLLGQSIPVMKLAFALTALLYVVTARIIVVVVAFKDSIGKGFLCLCIEIYTIYYVFKESESGFLKALYGLVLLMWLLFYTIKP